MSGPNKIICLTVFCLLTGCASTSQQRLIGIDRVYYGRNTKIIIKEIGLYKSEDTTEHIAQLLVDSCNSHPFLSKKVLPVYPEIVNRAGVEGTVTVEAWIDTSGKVIKAKVLSFYTNQRRSDFDTLLYQPALDAMLKCGYSPYRTNCKLEDFISIVKYEFTLEVPRK
ncbi:MAG: TonB family protein [Bacteroidota bacterium]|nr:TonB family protein [Bacteroidota bacterium]